MMKQLSKTFFFLLRKRFFYGYKHFLGLFFSETPQIGTALVEGMRTHFVVADVAAVGCYFPTACRCS